MFYSERLIFDGSYRPQTTADEPPSRKPVGDKPALRNVTPVPPELQQLPLDALQLALGFGQPVAPITSPLAALDLAALLTPAALDVLAERHRQITGEGWTPEHDHMHSSGELAGAAAAYAAYRSHVPAEIVMGESLMQMLWPWSPEWWKPTTPRRDLVKATALLLAEIERLDRTAEQNLLPEAGA